jgi:hypothetical protein
MSCKYSAEWWRKYESMTATATSSEKVQPVGALEQQEGGRRPGGQSGGTDDRVARRGGVAVLDR